MEAFFTKSRIKNLIIAATLVVLGIVFCAMNSSAAEIIRVLGYISGGLLIALGVILIAMYFVNFKQQISGKNFIYGGLAIVLGLLMVISNDFITFLMILAVGFFLCALGIIYMSKAFENLRLGHKNIWKELSYGIVSFILGIVLLVLIVVSSSAIVIFMGIALILAGVCLCLMVIFGDKITVSLKKQIEHEDRKEEKVAEQKKETKSTTEKTTTDTKKTTK